MQTLFEHKGEKKLLSPNRLGLTGYISRCGHWRLIWELENGKVAFRKLARRDQIYGKTFK